MLGICYPKSWVSASITQKVGFLHLGNCTNWVTDTQICWVRDNPKHLGISYPKFWVSATQIGWVTDTQNCWVSVTQPIWVSVTQNFVYVRHLLLRFGTKKLNFFICDGIIAKTFMDTLKSMEYCFYEYVNILCDIHMVSSDK